MELDCRKFAPEPMVKQDKGSELRHRRHYLHANETFMREEKILLIEMVNRYND